MLGITRFETTPSPVPSDQLLASDTAHNLQRKDNKLNASEHSVSIVSSDIGTYESIEQLNKTTGCFPLDRYKTKKATNNNTSNVTRIAANDAINALSQPHDIQLIDQKSQRNHFDRSSERLQSTENQPNLGVNGTQRAGTIEQKPFSRWLTLSRTKRLERVKCSNDVDQWQTLRTPVIRKCSTKSNSIRKAIKKSTKPSSSTSSSRFSSCIPYCVAAARSRTNSVAGNSLASSHRYAEYCKKRSGASASNDQHRLPTSNDCLMHSYCKSNKHCSPSNKNTDNNHNNNCSLFNNLNIMDRSVDSIGSCSLDVDAESTDFSGIK